MIHRSVGGEDAIERAPDRKTGAQRSTAQKCTAVQGPASVIETILCFFIQPSSGVWIPILVRNAPGAARSNARLLIADPA